MAHNMRKAVWKIWKSPFAKEIRSKEAANHKPPTISVIPATKRLHNVMSPPLAAMMPSKDDDSNVVVSGKSPDGHFQP